MSCMFLLHFGETIKDVFLFLNKIMLSPHSPRMSFRHCGDFMKCMCPGVSNEGRP